MSNFPIQLLDEFDLPDWDGLNPAQVELSPEQMQQAAQLSQSIRDSNQRWQAYLAMLGRMGFQQWLRDRAPDLTVAMLPERSPQRPCEIIQVGAFKVCLIPVDYSVEDTISLPIAPDVAAHFYVLTQAIEEEGKVAVAGFLSYEQYRAQPTLSDAVPLSAFNSDADALLLNLRCLEPSAIRLPVQATESVINVGLWLRNQVDAIAQELGWMLMPNLSALRSLREDFDSIRSTLEQQGVQIPSEARGAYRTLRSEQGSFRLYAVTWVLSEDSEWMLLVALGAEPNEALPSRLRLSIRDQIEPLFEETLEDLGRSVLYAQVVGNWNEQFWVTVTANESDVFEIPPFGFEIDA